MSENKLVWHNCKYVNGVLEHDGTWVDGRWYYWTTGYGDVHIARLTGDEWFHLRGPNSGNGMVIEERFVAFAEIPLHADEAENT